MVNQWGYRRKDFPHASPEDLARLIFRCARSRGSQAVLRARRAKRDPFSVLGLG